jgi:hypothetical protein
MIFHYNEFNGIASLDPAFAKTSQPCGLLISFIIPWLR